MLARHEEQRTRKSGLERLCACRIERARTLREKPCSAPEGRRTRSDKLRCDMGARWVACARMQCSARPRDDTDAGNGHARFIRVQFSVLRWRTDENPSSITRYRCGRAEGSGLQFSLSMDH